MPAQSAAVTRIDLPGIAHVRSGKVRELFELGDCLLMVATDRLSAFDVVLPTGIPDKGKILNQLSAFWFQRLGEIVDNHCITIEDAKISSILGAAYDERQLFGRCMLVQKCEPILMESVVRDYICGSLYKEYVAAGGVSQQVALHGINLQQGLLNCQKLNETIFTPATKAASGHDENISLARAGEVVGMDIAQSCRLAAMRLFAAARSICASSGIILADTKFEFGKCGGELKLIDEALTPDSSRFWLQEKYAPGRSQESLDKQFVRNFLEGLDWDKKPPGPELPPGVAEETRSRYLEIFERITGRMPVLQP